MPPNLDRRAFLALGLGAIAWACARRTEEPNEEPTDAAGPPAPTGAGAISIIATAPMGLAVGDTRQGLAILRGQKPIAPGKVDVRLVPPGGEPFDVEADRQEVLLGPGGHEGHAHEHPEGTEVTTIYTLRHDFDRSGIWDMLVEFESEGDDERGSAQFQIADSSPSPAVGDKAVVTKSPTTEDPRGVDPVCTRDPVCTMHEVTIAEALDAKKPTVIVFATPRFCTSRTCGPVVDFIERAKEKHADEASFVHVEIWKDDDDSVGKQGGESPSFAEWKLQTEPWIYFVGSDGVVKDRWMGAAGEDEIMTGVEGLLA